jgi:hypothetical protein
MCLPVFLQDDLAVYAVQQSGKGLVGGLAGNPNGGGLASNSELYSTLSDSSLTGGADTDKDLEIQVRQDVHRSMYTLQAWG